MAQTTGGMSMVAALVEFATDGATYNDISGVANSVEISGNDRSSGELFTAEGDTGIVTFGKLNPADVTYNIVYSEDASEAFEQLRALHVAAGGTKLTFRWAPAGTGTGNSQFTTGTGKITEFPWPGGEVGGGEPIAVSVIGHFPSITKGVQ